MTMESFLCLPAWGAFVTSTSFLHFYLSFHDEYTGNGRPGANEYCVTTGRLGLGLVGLEGDALGSSALLARDRDNQLFLGLGRRRVRVETACRTFDCLDFGDGCDYLAMALAWDVGGRKILVERQGTYWRALPRARARFPGKFLFRKNPPWNCVFVDEEGYPYLVPFGLLRL